jgi:phage terminase large subunit
MSLVAEAVSADADFDLDLDFPESLEFLFDKDLRYKVAYGGRGGLKSWNFARALLLIGAEEPVRVLCGREYQNSIKESVHHVLSEQIEELGLQDDYHIGQQEITGYNGTEFIFAGIKTNPLKIKSMEGIDIAWIEEAEAVSNASWKVLIPTIRKPGSQIWISFNTGDESDPTYQRFVVNTPPRTKVIKLTYKDNKWLSRELYDEMVHMRGTDYESYLNVWEGEIRQNSSAKVLRNKCISTWFEPGLDWDGPYFGADWGFAEDPSTLIKCWIHGNKLYIEKEMYGKHIELNDLSSRYTATMPEAKHFAIRGDNSRPETISHVRQMGYPKLMAAGKWPGSVEDGIAFLRGFKQIVIHPDCPKTYEESKLWRYKVDRLTEDVLPILVDGNDHCWDAVRYALEPIIKSSKLGLLSFYSGQVALKQQQRR